MFNEERLFLENALGVKLPEFCWKEGKSILLNHDSEKSILDYTVVNGKLQIKKNLLKAIVGNQVVVEFTKNKKKLVETWRNNSWEEEIEQEDDRIEALYRESYEMTKAYILAHPGYELEVSISGGKDSDLMFRVVMDVLRDLGIDDYVINYFNTTNEVGHTYRHVKFCYNPDKLRIVNPEKGQYKWLAEDKNWYIPSVMSRTCCDKYKEGQLDTILDKDKKYIIFLGARRQESNKRCDYSWDLNEALLAKAEREAEEYRKEHGKEPENTFKLNVPLEWRRFLPIVEWTDADVWLYILKHKMKFNYMYRLGYNRVGCLICPYMDDYVDLLNRHYFPTLAKRWDYAVEMNYHTYNVETRLKWSLEEWQLGRWKTAVSKEYEILRLAPTPDRINELATIKGISIRMAKKFFNRTCSCCGKKLNPDEISMNFKVNGRFEHMRDELETNRKMFCKKHMCEKEGWSPKQYKEKVINFREQGCELF